MVQLSVRDILVQAFFTSDAVGKGIIVILLVGSLILWSILANKWLSINSTSRAVKSFFRQYDKLSSPLSIGLQLDSQSGPLKRICEAGIKEFFRICEISDRRKQAVLMSGTLPRALTQPELEKIRITMNRQVNQETAELEENLGMLSVLITVSPYLGLFGTVWGVMATFMSIATMGRIEISEIAPGISGALLTTVAGLFVAIPAVIGNIIINSKINDITLKMDIFVDNFISSLSIEEGSDSAPATANNTSNEDI